MIPALNEETSLSFCLASVTSQRFEGGMEVIVVDNGSTDNTASVAQRYGAKVIPCKRRGVVFARQVGLESAAGQVIVHLDADSRLKPDTLSRLAADFARPDVAVVVGDVDYSPTSLGPNVMRRVYRATNTTLNLVMRRPMFALAGALALRRDFFLRAGGYDIRQPHTADEAGILGRLHKHGRVVWDGRFVVASSDRRFHGRFAQWLVSDLFVHTFLDQLAYKLTKRSRWGDRPDFR